MDRKTEAIRVNVEPEIRQQLEQLANEHDRSMAYLIREAIKRYLKEMER